VYVVETIKNPGRADTYLIRSGSNRWEKGDTLSIDGAFWRVTGPTRQINGMVAVAPATAQDYATRTVRVSIGSGLSAEAAASHIGEVVEVDGASAIIRRIGSRPFGSAFGGGVARFGIAQIVTAEEAAVAADKRARKLAAAEAKRQADNAAHPERRFQ
jgi:hypothetical protein